MIIGLDIHGVIDKHAGLFQHFAMEWKKNGDKIYIITGQSWNEVKHTVHEAGIPYHGHFSIVDHHRNIKTEMSMDTKGRYWMDKEVWERSKGDYCERMHIDIHFDDSLEYGQYMPSSCTFVHIPREMTSYNLFPFLKNILDLKKELCDIRK